MRRCTSLPRNLSVKPGALLERMSPQRCHYRRNPVRACASSDIIRIVEHLLNLLWLTVVSVLFASTVVCSRRGMLRCSLPVALGVVGLLAVVLFPAVSMTDDLQRAKMAAETSWQQANGSVFPGSRQDGPAIAVALLPFLLLAMLFGAVMRRIESLSRRRQTWKIYELVAVRPQSPRPPPFGCAA